MSDRNYRIKVPDARDLTAAMALPGGHPLSFIGNLDDVCARALFRFLSEKPNHPDWCRFITSENLMTAIRCGGPLRDGSKLDIISLGTQQCLVQREGIGACIVDSSHHLLEAVTAAGASLKYLQICNRIVVSQTFVPSFLRTLGSNVDHLRKLDVSELENKLLVEALLVVMAGRIEALTACLSHSNLIALHGAGIRELRFTSWCGEMATEVAKTVGPTLESFADSTIGFLVAHLLLNPCSFIVTGCDGWKYLHSPTGIPSS